MEFLFKSYQCHIRHLPTKEVVLIAKNKANYIVAIQALYFSINILNTNYRYKTIIDLIKKN